MKVVGFVQLSPRVKLSVIISLALIFIISSMYYVQAYHRFKPVYSVETDQKVVALTFDISWGNKSPGPILDVLKKENVRATFFLSGPWVKQYPEIAQRIKADGHEIGSHGYRHINLSTLPALEVREEIKKAGEAINEVTGVKPNLIRTPNGDYNDVVIKAAHELNYEVIQWSVDSLDWMNPGVSIITERVANKAHKGAIILMHASDTCQQTDKALPIIIKNLRDQGYKFVTIPELLKMGAKAN